MPISFWPSKKSKKSEDYRQRNEESRRVWCHLLATIQSERNGQYKGSDRIGYGQLIFRSRQTKREHSFLFNRDNNFAPSSMPRVSECIVCQKWIFRKRTRKRATDVSPPHQNGWLPGWRERKRERWKMVQGVSPFNDLVDRCPLH